MDALFEGLSTPLSEEDKVLLKSKIDAEKKEWMKAAQNDEDFISNLRTQSEGKVYSTVERFLKKSTGLKFEDIPSDSKGGDRFKEMLKMSLDTIKSSKDETNQELQNQLLEAKEEARKLREEEIPNIESQYAQKFNAKRIDSKLTELIASKNNIIQERIGSAKIFANAVLSTRYKLGWDNENDGIDIKTHKDLTPVLNDKTVGFNEVLESILDEGGFIQKSNGTEGRINRTPNPEKIAPTKMQWGENAKKMANELGISLD